MTADLSLVPDSYSAEGETYKFTSVCSATFNAIYNESENRYSNKYAAATILAIGLICSAYVAGGKTRRLCTGNKEDVDEAENDFMEMNKIDENAEGKAIESEVSTSPSQADILKEKIQSKRHFPDFFRRQTKPKPITNGTDTSSTTNISVLDQRNAFLAV